MSLRNRRILITAGPTWVPIDTVRVITNIATGETGILLAQEAEKQGAKVTLLLGPVADNGDCLSNKKIAKIKIIRFKFFNELKDRLIKELCTKKYDIVIHSAAVSDYRPKNLYKNKIKSGINLLRLDLIPTPKILDLIKKIDASLLLAAFKFETQAPKRKLIDKSKEISMRSRADLVVVNTVLNNHYLAYIIGKDKTRMPIFSKDRLAKELIKKIGEMICQNPN